MEVEKLRRDYDLDVRWAPFLLDPSIPPEGRSREPRTKPGDPPTDLELRGRRSGIAFRRGRTFTPSSLLSLEAAEYAQDCGHDGDALHRALFRTHFEEDGDLGDLDTLVRLGAEAGLDADGLREALESRRYRGRVADGIGWARAIGVTGVPTFIFDDRYGVVGAQEYDVFERVMEQLGVPRRGGAAADGGSAGGGNGGAA